MVLRWWFVQNLGFSMGLKLSTSEGFLNDKAGMGFNQPGFMVNLYCTAKLGPDVGW